MKMYATEIRGYGTIKFFSITTFNENEISKHLNKSEKVTNLLKTYPKRVGEKGKAKRRMVVLRQDGNPKRNPVIALFGITRINEKQWFHLFSRSLDVALEMTKEEIDFLFRMYEYAQKIAKRRNQSRIYVSQIGD